LLAKPWYNYLHLIYEAYIFSQELDEVVHCKSCLWITTHTKCIEFHLRTLIMGKYFANAACSTFFMKKTELYWLNCNIFTIIWRSTDTQAGKWETIGIASPTKSCLTSLAMDEQEYWYAQSINELEFLFFFVLTSI
jgi:hypothetical protein